MAATPIEQLKREALAGLDRLDATLANMPPLLPVMNKQADMDTVRMLKTFGHDMAKAFEIELDARRGDKHAVAWVELARKFLVKGLTP